MVWRLKDENQKLLVKLMKEDEKSPLFARRPGDGGSEENCSRPTLTSETNFKRTMIRSTYHCELIS